MKPAVGYIRFSREDQGKGSTIERQSENILAYCQQHGLDLVETLTDEGFSASKGEHISHPKAKFGAFLARVDKGEYRVMRSSSSSSIGYPAWALTHRLRLSAGCSRAASFRTSAKKTDPSRL